MRSVVVVLAGGNSRRMAPVDKLSLVHPGGEPMLRRVLRTLPADGTVRLVAPRARWPALQALDLGDVRWVADDGAGPMQALVRATDDLPDPTLVLVVPGDLARPHPGLFSRLVDGSGEDGACIAGRFGFMLPLGVRRSVIDAHRAQVRLSVLVRSPGMVRLRWRALSGLERLGLVDVDRPSVARSHRLACPGIACHR